MSGPLVRARQIIPRCLDGVATDAEIAELDRLLAEHSDVARELARAAKLESGLETVLRPPDLSDVAARGMAVSTAATALERAPIPRPSARRIIVTASATLAVAAAALLVWSLRGSPRDLGIQSQTTVRSDLPEKQRFSDGSLAELRTPDSQIETRSVTSEGVDVSLVRGAARFEVVPRAGHHFRVWVGSLRVDVVGTVFTVERLVASVRVSVERGSVRVISKDGETLLAPGSAEILPMPESAPAPSGPRAAPGPSEPRSAVERDDASALLGMAERARRAGRPKDAVAPLQRMVDHHPHDPRAAYAAFILGRVLLDEIGRPREAAAAFARVGALDPETPLLPDALAREVESWSRAGEAERAKARGREYLSRYPDGRRKQEVRRYSRME